MNKELSNFAARLRETISVGDDVRSLMLHTSNSEIRTPKGSEPPHVGSYDNPFNSLALELFALQFKYNAAYRKICDVRRLTPEAVEHWTQIPAAPAAAFKELELSCIPPEERTAVFHSSGTTEQRRSRHFHCPASLELYETSLWSWFERNVLRSAGDSSACLENTDGSLSTGGQAVRAPFTVICLTPPAVAAPHSSLVHMFETIRRKLGAAESVFVGKTAADGAWTLDFDAALAALNKSPTTNHQSLLILGTAFSFVHLLDYLVERDLRVELPAGSRVMETGGYKNRSRTMPKEELHMLMTERLGVPPENIVCEYGMSELSSQAYAVASDTWQVTRNDGALCHLSPATCHFHFPPWARAQIISPETGLEVADGKSGLIRVFDLANISSVMAVQTEDLGVRHADGFELLGRAQMAELRGCSLMST